MGIDTNHIVTPLPSGVISAPKMTRMSTAYRKFLRQNLGEIVPVSDMPYISIGSWKAIPKPRKNCITNEIKLLIVRKVATLRASPYWYKKSRINGITKTYENAIPPMKSAIEGRNTFTNPIFVLVLIAGEMNADISLMMKGIETVRPISAET